MELNTKSFYHIPSGIPKEVCEIISNELPIDLYGTYYRNGHSKFEAGDVDGYIVCMQLYIL